MANITKVYLLAVPLEKDYQHTLHFGSAESQRSYFTGRIRKTYENCSYQRKDGTIRIPAQVDSLYAAGVNYVMYQNSAYGNRWFYAFITEMKYIDDGRTDVTIKTDCVQTWMFDITVHPSFVEREHVMSDKLGEHTIEEGLELGEYQCNLHSFSDYAGDNMAIVIGVTKKADGEKVQGMLYNNIYSGVRYYSFDAGDSAAVNAFLAEYDDEGIGEAVTCMFLAPQTIAPVRSDHLVAGSNFTYDFYINGSASVDGVQKTLTKETLEGYTPRNKKLLTFPYRYLLVTNNAGASVPFRYEFFNVDGNVTDPKFLIEGVLTPGCSVRMVPLTYAGAYRNDEHGVNMGKFPILNWTSDVYTNWLTQNGVNIAISLATGAAQVAGGAALAYASGGLAMAAGGSSMISGAAQITNTLAQIHQQSFSPPQAKGNLNSGDVVTATKRNDFHFYDMTIRKEYAQIIDEYFDMFGYKCNRVKVPAKAHRENYWYIKTIDANITGDIPQEDLQTIKDCYNQGITFWRANGNFRNYGCSNGIL